MFIFTFSLLLHQKSSINMLLEKIQTLRTAVAASFLAVTFTLVGCGETASNDGQKNDTSKKENNIVAKEKIEQVAKSAPKPSELPALLEIADAEYNETLLNNVKNVDKYLTTNNLAAANLGIYAVDLGYALNYDKTQNAIDYLQATKKLAEKVGVTSAIDPKVLANFQKNIGKKDTLIKLVDDAVENIDNYLKDNKQTTLSAMVLAGTFVEGLYIATSVIEQYPKDVPKNVKDMVTANLISVVVKQEKSLANVIASLEAVKRDKNGDELLAGLKEIKVAYEKSQLNKKIDENKGDLKITDKDLIEITQKIRAIRKKLTE
jgi:hypothetical protein